MLAVDVPNAKGRPSRGTVFKPHPTSPTAEKPHACQCRPSQHGRTCPNPTRPPHLPQGASAGVMPMPPLVVMAHVQFAPHHAPPQLAPRLRPQGPIWGAPPTPTPTRAPTRPLYCPTCDVEGHSSFKTPMVGGLFNSVFLLAGPAYMHPPIPPILPPVSPVHPWPRRYECPFCPV